MKRKKRALCLFLLSLAPLVLGVVGYQIDRISFADALYAAIALYRGEVLYDSDNLYLEVARWTALLATTTIVLRCFQNLWNVLSCQLLSRFSDSVAVYSKRKITFGDGVHAFYSERAVKHAASHIIIKENDRETLCFYEENRDTFRGKRFTSD